MSNKRFAAVVLVSVFGIFLIDGLVSAASSFLGQGTVPFDSIRIGREGEGGVTFFNGTIINETTGTGGSDNPVTFGDSIRVDGRIWRGAEQGPGDPNPTIIDDDLTVEGDILYNGGNSLTTTLSWTADMWDLQVGINDNLLDADDSHDSSISILASNDDVLDSSIEALSSDQDLLEESVSNLQHFLQCVGNMAETTTYLWSSDYISCWNIWMAGTTMLSDGAVASAMDATAGE